MDLELFATVPRGMESLLAGELKQLGATGVRQARAGVAFRGSLEVAYRACLWSRLASRVLLRLLEGRAATADELYETVRRIDWRSHLDAQGTLAVDFTGTSAELRDTRFSAVRVKDAIVDQLRERGGSRPSVDVRDPDVRVNAHLARGKVTLAIDLSGESLHRRGYRTDKVQAQAPLKENLAAAVLLYAAWPKVAAAGGSLLDPLCGSGTLPVEAALMAADVAPGLLRAEAGRFGFARWRGHDEAAWRALVAEARERREAGLGRLKAAGPGHIAGSDHDPAAVHIAQACARRAGLGELVALSRAELAVLRPAPAARPGLLAANPPYGERLGERRDAEAVYRLLGERLRAAFGGWQAVLLAGDPALLDAARLPVLRSTTLYNGALPVTVALCDAGSAGSGPGAGPVTAAGAEVRSARALARSSKGTPAPPGAAEPSGAPSPTPSPTPSPGPLLSAGAEQLANRLRKNRRHLGRQLRREGITCYRLYDADLPEYNFAVDVYGEWVHVQEYMAPPEIDPDKARRRRDEALAVIGAELEAPPGRVVLKERRRQRGAAQYERRAGGGALVPITEDDLTYLVDLTGHLDTGLFIDQRLTRRLVRRLAGGRRFLNLFAYTGTMTVDALAGGSPASTTVDLSRTYLDWARRNLAANGFEVPAPEPPATGHERPAVSPHRLVQADVLQWLADPEPAGPYDLVWLDPPTFSNSKRMGRATFDVQRDHADLLRLVTRRLLAPGGILLFATNRRNFRLEHEALTGLVVHDLSRATLPADCARMAGRHHVFRVEAPGRS